uniref:Transmembrane protein 203 n=1 Tax=Lepeophtheirus salmonis TaxID=72036 RepID=D3PGP5_LEPSM|nr:transmembrane protein 203-like [Lepeophtheirus salmonis]ADD24441.1 Transmembrane protein 203 [Lepeophtheirus salmonis]
MFFQLREILRWFGLTVFEIFVGLICFTLFTIFLTCKVEGLLGHWSWWLVFSPLFVSDGLNAYFVIIIYIRMHLDGSYKSAQIRMAWSLFVLMVLLVFKYFLCQKLSGEAVMDYSELMSPIFILLQLIMVRACQLS